MSLDDPKALQHAAHDASRATGRHVHFDRSYRKNSILGAARFTLDNGLTILFAPDDRAAIFAYQTWFKVGSKDEEPTRTGMAHFFEHLMFKATKRHALGELDREMERRGSQTNAATWVDWTYYHEALAARDDNFTTVVEFEADRINGLLLDEHTFRSELEVVKNERRMSVDDSVSGSMSEALYRLAYTTHPYRWPTIGSMEHLSTATMGELERFYRTYYAPSNAVVVVAGALEPVATLTTLAQAYGPLPAQPKPTRSWSAEPVQIAPRATTITRSVVTPQLCLGYHSPAQHHPDYTAVQLLAETLLAGDNARLYRRLVTDEKLAASVEGVLMPFAEPGLYEIFIVARDGVDPEKIVAVAQDELDAIANGITDQEDEKARNSIELEILESQRHAIAIADSLGHHEVSVGDFASAFTTDERLAKTSRADLSGAAASVFRAGNRCTVVAAAETTEQRTHD